MLIAPILLTPLMLAVEPARIEMPDLIYDHKTQTSTFKGKVHTAQCKYTPTFHGTNFGNYTVSDSDGDCGW